MGKYQIAEVGVDPIANPLPKERRRLPWFWILMFAALLGCGVTFGITRLSAQAGSASKAQPTPSRTYVVEISSLTNTPTPSATPTVTPTLASTQTPWIVTRDITREVAHDVEVIRITIQMVDRQVVVAQDRAVIVTGKVPWVITQIAVITTTPLPTYTPYPTYTRDPSQTPWVITATPSETPTPSSTPYYEPVTNTPTATPTETATLSETPTP
jgi:hypothetical protein